MRSAHRCIATAFAVLLLSGCTTPATQPTNTQTPPATSPASTTSSTAAPPTLSPTHSPAASTTSPTQDGDTSTATTPPASTTTTPPGTAKTPTPVAKVQRSSQTANPTVSASPTGIEEKVTYPDGVALHIDNIEFGKETQEGPGHFPGRAYAILSLAVVNGSKQPIDLNTTVVTVLNAEDQPVAPVYVEEAKVVDFSGKAQPGKTAEARYAFAVTQDSRSQVTVIVDFDGVHTSAVFHGELT